MPAHASALPPEVLLKIIRLAIGNPVEYEKTRASILLTCKPWKEVLLTPSLWAVIDITYPISTLDNNLKQFEETSFLLQCLELSHPVPLTITIDDNCLYVDNDSDQKVRAEMRRTLTLLLGHSLRWKTFNFKGHCNNIWLGYVITHLDGIQSDTLQTLKIIDTGDGGPTEEPDIHLPASLRNLQTEYPIAQLKLHWPSVTSLTVSFETLDEFHQIISMTQNLVTLGVTHIGVAESQVQARTAPITLPTVKSLLLFPCAFVDGLEDCRFPNMTKLSLPTPTAFHSHRCHLSSSTTQERLLRTIPQFGAPLRVLDVEENFDWAQSIPLLRRYEHTLVTVHAYIAETEFPDSLRDLMRVLTFNADVPLLPHLSNLHIQTGRFSQKRLSQSTAESLERLVLSRRQSERAGMATKLRKLRVDLCKFEDYEYVRYDDVYGSDEADWPQLQYRSSSLAMHLRKFSGRQKGYGNRKDWLDVEWIYDGVDILERV